MVGQSDLAELTTAADYLQKRYIEMGQSQEFVTMLGDLVTLTTQRVESYPGHSPAMSGTPRGSQRDTIISVATVNDGRNGIVDPSTSNDQQFHNSSTGDLMDLWPRVMGEDLELSALFGNEIYEPGTSYHFFGLPP